MAKQSSVNLDITNNADGFDISGGTTARKLGITGGDVTIAGSGSATVTFPTTSTTIAGLGITQSFSALQTFSAGISAAGGVTLAGTLQGTTASFTRLVSSTVGFSGAGTDLTGNASGLTAGTATRVITTSTNSASTFYPTFVSGAGNTALFIDPTLGPLSYVPSTATLKLTNLDIAAGALTIGAFQLTASTYFYFVASTGINFQDPTLISMGDYGAVAGKTLFEVYPTVGTRYACLYNSDFANNATLMVNRLSPVGTHAFEVNRSDGKAAKLIYGDTGGAASNYVDLDVSSAGNLTITPSGSLVTITGRLDVSAGISAAGGVTLAGTFSGTTAAFTGLVSSTVGFSGSGTNLKNIVTTFNGLSGAVTGASLGANTFTALNTFNAGISAAGATFSAPITSTRMARHTSAVISAIKTASFSPTVAEDGTVFYISYSGKGMNVTLEGLPIGWRAKFFNLEGGNVLFESTTGNAYGYGANYGLGEFLLEAICIDTNTYFIG